MTRFVSLPEARFTCRHSGACCRAPWSIVGPDGSPMPRRPDGECVHHVDGRCALHAAAGHQVVPTCATFPFGFTGTPTGTRVWTSFTCPTVRANLGAPLTDRDLQVAQRGVATLEPMPDPLALVPGVPVAFADYEAFEAGVLDLLADEGSGPPLERVRRALGALGHFAVGIADRSLTPSRARGLAARGTAPLARDPLAVGGVEAAGAALYLLLRHRRPERLQALGLAEPQLLQLPLVLEGRGFADPPATDLVARYLRQVLFRARWLAEFGVAGHLHTVALIEALVRHLARVGALAEGRREVVASDLDDAVQVVEEATVHSDLLLQAVLRHPELGPLVRSSGICR